MEKKIKDTNDFLATRRTELLTSKDFKNQKDKVIDTFKNKKILVLGGAGSIGSSFIYEVSKLGLKSIHIIDPNENGLTDLVRNLRSKNEKESSLDLITSPLDFGSKVTEQFIKENGPYDTVFNFAAIKHVRSEKDIYSLIQMFDTNVVKQSNFIQFLIDNKLTERYFTVSTDKAANPVSLMGASKKIMELVLQHKHLQQNNILKTSTTRFANVAFSRGSLLQSYPIRFDRREPLPAPKHIARYFVSHEEAAQICILSSLDIENGDILVPKTGDSLKLYPILSVAKNFIESKGLEPILVESKEEAYKVIEKNESVKYPIVLTEPDTSGEKKFEEFIGINEKTLESQYTNFDVVQHSEFNVDMLKSFIESFNSMLQGGPFFDRDELIEDVKGLVDSFNHVDTGVNLDNRM
tara:strand:- start:1182 stop:2405 length:1224 start_codon:yes stop_codon:yes gene_type:complete